MSNIEITYDGAPLAYDVPPTKISVPQRAELGSISMGSLGIEDPAAALALVGHRPIYVEELDCSQPRLFTGWVVDRNIGRSFEQTQFVGADARIHDTTITDLNALFGFRIITGADGNRPSETIGVRLTWLLASSYLTGLIDDTGKVTYPGGTPMESADYRGSYPADVMAELLDLTQTPINWFAFWDPAPDTGSPRCGLYFDNVGAAANICTISVSNVLADLNGTTVFAPNVEARLETTPETVVSDVIVEYLGASVFRNLASTETAHIKRGTKISRPRTGKVSTATAQADAYLASHAHEVDRITPTIHVPSSVVGLLWAGQRMDVKFSHLPGYTSWTSMQIVASNPRPVDDLADWYDVDLELVSPRIAVVLAVGGPVALVEAWSTGWGVAGGGSDGAGLCTFTATAGTRYSVVVRETNNLGWGTIVGLSSVGVPVTAGGAGHFSCPADNWEETLADWTETTTHEASAYLSGGDGVHCDGAGGDWMATRRTLTVYEYPAGAVTTGGTIPPKPGETTVATTDPTATDDSDHGYVVGVHWVNSATGLEYVLVDSTVGAAVWTITTVFGGLTVSGVPTVGLVLAATSPTTAAWVPLAAVGVRYWPMLSLTSNP